MPIEIEIDGETKTLSEDDVKNLLDQQKSATQKTQKVAAILSACDRYGVDPEEFLSRSEGAFGLLNTLVDSGVIDNEGNLKVTRKDADPGSPPSPPPGDDDPTTFPPDKSQEAIQKALGSVLEDKLNPLVKKVETLSADTSRLMTRSLVSDLQKKYPDMTTEDAVKVLATAKEDRNKTLGQHAEEFVQTKTQSQLEMEKKFAEKYGVDLEKADPNKRNEFAEGGAGVLIKDKKISFSPNDESGVTPQEATKQYFEKLEE